MDSSEVRYNIAPIEDQPRWYRCSDTLSGIEVDFDIRDINQRQECRWRGPVAKEGAHVLARYVRDIGEFIRSWAVEKASKEKEIINELLSLLPIDRSKMEEILERIYTQDYAREKDLIQLQEIGVPVCAAVSESIGSEHVDWYKFSYEMIVGLLGVCAGLAKRWSENMDYS